MAAAGTSVAVVAAEPAVAAIGVAVVVSMLVATAAVAVGTVPDGTAVVAEVAVAAKVEAAETSVVVAAAPGSTAVMMSVAVTADLSLLLLVRKTDGYGGTNGWTQCRCIHLLAKVLCKNFTRGWCRSRSESIARPLSWYFQHGANLVDSRREEGKYNQQRRRVVYNLVWQLLVRVRLR